MNKAYVLESDLPTPVQTYVTGISNAVNSMQGDIHYASDFRQNLVDSLDIEETIIENGMFNSAGVGYVRWLQANTNLGWYAFQVSRIACIYVSVYG